MFMSDYNPSTRYSSPKMWSNSNSFFWRTRWPRKISSGLKPSANSAAHRWQWANCSTIPASGSRLSRCLIDFVRMHISQMGGMTPARDVALFANMYGIRTAWHGPGDTSPVGHAANLHLDVWAPNFGVQEWCRFTELVYEMFPGMPKSVTVTCIPMTTPAWVSTLTRNWRPSIPVRIRWKRGLKHVYRTAVLRALETLR